VNELSYRALVWLTYRLAATFAVGLPLVLLIWSAWRRDAMVLRLLGLYWKVASLMGISVLLLVDERPLGYLTAVVAPLLMVVSVWFWGLAMTTTGLSCLQGGQTASCLAWLEAPQGLHGLAATVFDFIFGGQWTEAFAAFVGYVALVAYLAGLLQWLLIRLPRYGRVAGDF